MNQNSLFAVCLIALTGFCSAAQASEKQPGCKIDAVELLCASSLKDRATIMEAMANPNSLTTIKEAQANNLLFPKAIDRETFRKSLKKNRAAALRHGRAMQRAHRRGKLDAEQYLEVRSKLEKGLILYRAGLDLYRQQVWFSKRRSRFADPGES